MFAWTSVTTALGRDWDATCALRATTSWFAGVGVKPSAPLQIASRLFLSSRCNYVLAVLLRFPIITDELRDSLLEDHATKANQSSTLLATWEDAFKDALNLMVDILTDRVCCTSDYATKSQPQAANLLQTLDDSMATHPRYAATRAAEGKLTENMGRAKLLPQSLVSAMNRQHHKRFLLIYAYLQDKPRHYCSHRFEHFALHSIREKFVILLQLCWAQQQRSSRLTCKGSDLTTFPIPHA